jgi:integrase/recombinase XerD
MAGGELMIAAIERYLATRRASGFSLSNVEYRLRSFARFAAVRQETHVRSATAIDWASESGSVAQRHTRYQTICSFATYVRLEDSRHEFPPPNHFGYRKTRRMPYIYSKADIERLILAATQLAPVNSLQPLTYVALISLLASTGLRISEALHLLISDITPQGLLIRRTKFKKTRMVPLHETAVEGLHRYMTSRKRFRTGGDHVFVSNSGDPLCYVRVYEMFRKLLKSANFQPQNGRWPRIHELRHTFAARALESSPAGRRSIGQHMLALATYMGHVNIDSTFWYLNATPDLMHDIAVAGESFLHGGRS